MNHSPDGIDHVWASPSIPFTIRPYTQDILLPSNTQHHSHDPLLFVKLVTYERQDRILPEPKDESTVSHGLTKDLTVLGKTHLSATPLRNRNTHFPPFGSSSQTGLRIEDANSYSQAHVTMSVTDDYSPSDNTRMSET